MAIETSFKDLKKEYNKKSIRRFNDMSDRFKDSSNVKGNPILYTVYVKDFVTFEVALTVLEPGNINGEYFMTKGHRHVKPREEIYILTSGKGKLIIQNGKNSKVVEMKKDFVYTVPARAGHRAVNTGKAKMEFLSIYSKDAGHDYNFKFGRRVFN